MPTKRLGFRNRDVPKSLKDGGGGGVERKKMPVRSPVDEKVGRAVSNARSLREAVDAGIEEGSK